MNLLKKWIALLTSKLKNLNPCHRLRVNNHRQRLVIEQLRYEADILGKKADRCEYLDTLMNKDENAIRALLMSLSVHGMQNNQREIGCGVTAFICNDVLTAIKSNPAMARDLCHHVAEVLVSRALKGLLYANSRGKSCAVIFDPKNGAVGNVFDCPERSGVFLARRRDGVADTKALVISSDEMLKQIGMAALPKEAESEL